MVFHRRLSCFLGVVLIVAWAAVARAEKVTLDSLTLDPSTVAGGNFVIGTVTLTAPAPASGFRVQLRSSNIDRARPTVSEITVIGGQASRQFLIQTFPIDQHPDVIDPDPTTTITASATSHPLGVRVARTANLTVTPAALLWFEVQSPIPSGTSAAATIRLSGPAPASGITIKLTSSHPANLTMPSSIVIPPGDQTATLTITPDPELYDVAITIQARRGTFDTNKAVLYVRVPEPERIHCPGRPPKIPEFTGGNDVKCNVRLDGRAPFDYPVHLSSSDEDYAKVNKHVTVPKGQWDADFLVQTVAVTEERTVTISGRGRYVTEAVTFRLVPARLKKVVVQPDPVTGGEIVDVIVYLTGPALTAMDITVDSSDPNVFEVLQPIHLAPGQSEGSRQVSTAEVDQDRDVVATARRGTDSVARQFVVKRTPRPDLVVYIARCRPPVLLAVNNVGEADAPASTLQVGVFSGGTWLSSISLPIPPLAHDSSTGVFQPNVEPAPGFRALADAPNAIKESNEENNIGVCH